MPDKLNFWVSHQLLMELVRLLRDSKENQRSCWPGFQFLFELAFLTRKMSADGSDVRYVE